MSHNNNVSLGPCNPPPIKGLPAMSHNNNASLGPWMTVMICPRCGAHLTNPDTHSHYQQALERGLPPVLWSLRRWVCRESSNPIVRLLPYALSGYYLWDTHSADGTDITRLPRSRGRIFKPVTVRNAQER